MATTKANNSEYQKSLAQYQAVAKYALDAFQKYVQPNDEVARMSAAQVEKALANVVLKWNENFTSVCTEIATEGMTVNVSPDTVFCVLSQLEKALKIKKADRVTFAHQYALAPEDVQATCYIPENIEEVCKCAVQGSDAKLRPSMAGVCLDFTNHAIVASDGRVLYALPMRTASGESQWIVPCDFLKAHAGEIAQCAVVDHKQYVYVCGERIKCVEGRYPNWRAVVPTFDKVPVHVGASAWKELAAQMAELSKVCCSCLVRMDGKEGNKHLTLKAANLDFGVSRSMDVDIEGEVPFDFNIGLNGAMLKKFSSMQDIYLTDQSRAVVYTDGMCLGLQMPMLLESSDHNVVGMNLVRWEAPTTKNICVPEVMSEETKTKTKTEAKAEETKTETKTETEKKAEVSPMMKQYADLKAKHPDAILLFRTGDFYETYKDDAKVCADVLGITLTKSTKQTDEEGNPLQMAGFPYHALDSYLPKLISAGKHVAICDQLEAPKLTKTKTETKTEVKEGTTPEAPAPAPVDEKPAEAPAPVKEEVCATPASKGSEALIDGKWVPVTVLTTNGTRAMVRKENGQRAIVKLSEIRGNIVDNTADAPKPVCETKTKTKTEETKTDAEAPAAVAEATGTKYADEKVYIKQYSEKSFILTGNTMPYHKQLKKYGSWWRKKEAWIFSNKRREFVEKLIGENLIAAA